MTTENFAPESTPSSLTPPSDYKEALVGPGKKYENEQEAIKALYHSQNHISKLEAEAAERERKLSEAKALEDVLSAIDGRNLEQPAIPASQGQPGLTPQQPHKAVEEPAPKEVNMEEAVRNILNQQREQEAAENNLQKAVEALDSRYGSRRATNEAVDQKARDLGISVSFLQDAARKSPKAFLQLMGSSSPASTQSFAGVTPTSINSSAFVEKNLSSQPQPGTARYYKALKKSDPAAYKRNYASMMKALEADPARFYERTT